MTSLNFSKLEANKGTTSQNSAKSNPQVGLFSGREAKKSSQEDGYVEKNKLSLEAQDRVVRVMSTTEFCESSNAQRSIVNANSMLSSHFNEVREILKRSGTHVEPSVQNTNQREIEKVFLHLKSRTEDGVEIFCPFYQRYEPSSPHRISRVKERMTNYINLRRDLTTLSEMHEPYSKGEKISKSIIKEWCDFVTNCIQCRELPFAFNLLDEKILNASFSIDDQTLKAKRAHIVLGYAHAIHKKFGIPALRNFLAKRQTYFCQKLATDSEKSALNTLDGLINTLIGTHVSWNVLIYSACYFQRLVKLHSRAPEA